MKQKNVFTKYFNNWAVLSLAASVVASVQLSSSDALAQAQDSKEKARAVSAAKSVSAKSKKKISKRGAKSSKRAALIGQSAQNKSASSVAELPSPAADLEKVNAASAASTSATSGALTPSGTTQSTESKTKLSDVAPGVNNQVKKKEGEEDIDQVVTNRMQRASVGKKSKYSFSFNGQYLGGTITSPGAATRPNIMAAVDTQDDPRLTGALAARYRFTPLQTLSLSIGVGIDKPFHGDDNQSFGDRSSLNDPSLTYSVVSKLGGFVSTTSVSATYWDNAFNRAAGYRMQYGIQEVIMTDFGGSRFTLGTSANILTNTFDIDRTSFNNRGLVGPQQTDFRAGIFPFMEVVLNDTLNFRTLLGFMAQRVRSEANFWTWRELRRYSSSGIGISITKDIFLYPNVQFIPEDMRPENTNVALNATINL